MDLLQAGQRSYHALRALQQRGYDARNLPGGFETWTASRDLDG